MNRGFDVRLDSDFFQVLIWIWALNGFDCRFGIGFGLGFGDPFWFDYKLGFDFGLGFVLFSGSDSVLVLEWVRF